MRALRPIISVLRPRIGHMDMHRRTLTYTTPEGAVGCHGGESKHGRLGRQPSMCRRWSVGRRSPRLLLLRL